MSEPRLRVRKTYKLYIGGEFPRSESGRSYPVSGPGGELLAHAAQASRKDVRDAVVAARKAFPGWSAATPYNRGQVLYRVAEMLDGRRDQFAAEVAAAEGGDAGTATAEGGDAGTATAEGGDAEGGDLAATPSPEGGDAATPSPEGGDLAAARAQVDEAIDRWVYYAGWADKYAQVSGGTNPVAGPYFNFSLPEPTGVVALIAPQESSLLGLVCVLAPAIATGNVAVVIASQARPLPAVSLAEVLGTSDLPAGVVNLLTGLTAELAPWLAGHRDVNAIDLSGVTMADRKALQIKAADNVKRVFAPPPSDWAAEPGVARLGAFVETKTVWHPIGL